MEKQKLEAIKKRISGSVFYRDRYTCTLELRRLARSLMMYVDDTLYENPLIGMQDVLNLGVPGFQRDNDKWSRERQVNFIENVFSGYRSTIQLYTTYRLQQKVGGLARCWILDGLQRLTALTDFINGEFKIFDNSIGFDSLLEAGLTRNAVIHLEVFTFKNDNEAAEFYIQLNRGITHSKEDIERAEQFIEINRMD